MIDEKKIEEAAGNFIEYLPYYEKDGKNLYDENSVITAFKEGINWFLDNLWHDASEEPKGNKALLIELEYDGAHFHVTSTKDANWKHDVEFCHITRWLYIEDLMKGGK